MRVLLVIIFSTATTWAVAQQPSDHGQKRELTPADSVRKTQRVQVKSDDLIVVPSTTNGNRQSNQTNKPTTNDAVVAPNGNAQDRSKNKVTPPNNGDIRIKDENDK